MRRTQIAVALLLAFFAGAGNSVYHPADFAILSARVSPRLTGRAFGIHAFGGTLGYAVSPILLSLLGYSLGWRTALILALFYGLAQAAIVWRAKDLLGGGPISAAAAKEGPRDIARGFVKLLTMPSLRFIIWAISNSTFENLTPCSAALCSA